MNVQEIVKQWLTDNGYDGLVNIEGDHCGCHFGDFMPCSGDCCCVLDCKPAYKQACKRNPAGFCMVTQKGIDPNCANCDA